MADLVLCFEGKLGHRPPVIRKNEEGIISKSFLSLFLKSNSSLTCPLSKGFPSVRRYHGNDAFKSCSSFRNRNVLHLPEEFLIIFLTGCPFSNVPCGIDPGQAFQAIDF